MLHKKTVIRFLITVLVLLDLEIILNQCKRVYSALEKAR